LLEKTFGRGVINPFRVALPEKEVPPPVPSDLTTTRSALFGRSLPNLHGGSMTAPPDVVTPPSHRSSVPSRAQPPGEQPRSQPSYGQCTFKTTNSRNSCRSYFSGDSAHISPDRGEAASGDVVDDSDGEYTDDQPSTSSGSRSRRSARHSKMSQDDISCLDYLTRLRLSKLMDENSKWQQLATELGCSHMIELISICSDDTSPTMILLDQFEQMPEAKISRVRSALHTLREEESVKLIDDRFIY
ncbi:death domain protein, partial [Cooperia oncophora]